MSSLSYLVLRMCFASASHVLCMCFACASHVLRMCFVCVVAQSVHHYSSFHPLYGVAMAQEMVLTRIACFVVTCGLLTISTGYQPYRQR